MRHQIPLVGLTGLPDSPWKFQQVIEFLHQLRRLVRSGAFEADGVVYFNLLYGKVPGAVGGTLQGQFLGLSETPRGREGAGG